MQALTLRDLRHLARGWTPDDWEVHIHDRLAAIPEQATPPQRDEVLAALSVGPRLSGCVLSLASSASAPTSKVRSPPWHMAGPRMLSRVLRTSTAFAMHAGAEPEVLRGRASILAISEVLTEHASYFDFGAAG